MTHTEILAKIDFYLRRSIVATDPYLASFFYSYSRKLFLKLFYEDSNFEKVEIPEKYLTEVFGLIFQSPIFNAAGIFKEVDGYEVAYKQGAGAFLIGTITPKLRKGNFKKGILHPFIPLASTSSAINWMGLPNLGFGEASERIKKIEKHNGCPIGISISFQPDSTYPESMNEIIEGFQLFERSQVDFIELNESCPNVAHHHDVETIGLLDKSLVSRLEELSQKFLKNRKRNLPIFVKFSNDTNPEQLIELIDLLIELGFDGINLGNTSTSYSEYLTKIDLKDKDNFKYFTETFGGGVSGTLLKEKSLNLSKIAAEYVCKKDLNREFVVIRTGGVESSEDIQVTLQSGIQMINWFTGYFENFSQNGHKLYQKILD